MRATVCEMPNVEASRAHYVTNRPPLMPNPFVKLPLGAVRPRGWLAHQLGLMVDGMTGRLAELSRFLADDNGWLGGDGQGWEEQPYWFRGFHDLAALTGDERLREEARRWIEAVFATQDGGGYFGPRCQRDIAGSDGARTTDLWPHMVMLDALIAHHELAGDERVLALMTAFFGYCRGLPEESFIPLDGRGRFTSWKVHVQHARAGDMLPHIYWLYNRTGDAWLLELAARFYAHVRGPQKEWLDRHIVNFTQRFSYPALFGQQTRAEWHLAQSEFWYRQHMATWGQQPRGIFAADEQIRPGKVDPRQGFETCGMTEFAKSFYLLGRATGGPEYADRCEDVMLNHFPAAQTPDLRGLHYLTASNLPQLDASSDHDFFNEEGEKVNPQLPYSPHRYRCCQHNVAMGWPWYAENLWQATGDGGLAAWLYAASEVSARAGAEGREVRVVEQTGYPFDQRVSLHFETKDATAFPLYLRVPRWCRGLRVAVNGGEVDVDARPRSYVRIDRTWRDGDRVELQMPMQVSLTRWPRTGAATVDRGPLSYSVRIEEEWRRCGGTDAWPEWEVYPMTPWNYGLVLDGDDPAGRMEVIEKGAVPDQPWTVEAAPVEIRAQAKRIPAWRLERQMVQELRPSPIRSDEALETIRMIPLGCARLRMSCLPVIGDGADARAWE